MAGIVMQHILRRREASIVFTLPPRHPRNGVHSSRAKFSSQLNPSARCRQGPLGACGDLSRGLCAARSLGTRFGHLQNLPGLAGQAAGLAALAAALPIPAIHRIRAAEE